jgi:hypothetical protein
MSIPKHQLSKMSTSVILEEIVNFQNVNYKKSQLEKMVNSMLKNGQLPKNNLAKMSTSVQLGEMVNYQNVNLQKVNLPKSQAICYLEKWSTTKMSTM